MISVLIFTLRSSQKTLFLNRHLFNLSCRRSQRCISLLSFYSNDFPLISEPGKNRKHVARRFGSHKSPEQSKKQDGIPANASSEHHHTTTVLQRLHDLEESFRVRGHSVLRWGLCALVVTGFVIYIFREPLRENVADEMADVASRSLADENVIQKADEVTRAVLQDVLHDPGITKLASAFVMEVLNRDDVRGAAIQLTQHVLSDPSTLKKIAELAKSTLSDLLTNDETRVLLLSYLKTLILDQGTKDACKLLLGELVEDPEVKGFMATSLGELVTSSVVKNSAAELGKSVTHQVVNDADIQQETGNFLWRAVKKTFTPGWFG